MENDRAFRKAKLRAGAKLGFYIHAAVFVVVNTLLAVINFTVSPGYLWFLWALMAWSVGLIFHALATFFFAGGSADNMVAKEYEKIQRQKV